MRSRISIRGCVRPSVRPSVGPSVRPSVRRSVGHTRVEILQKCRFWPKLLAVRARTHLMPCIRPCFTIYHVVHRNIAAFNQVCDWCKHVRHTVTYVTFQDGEQQLQFCSDKCLNQYKMNIFCKETQVRISFRCTTRPSETWREEAAKSMAPPLTAHIDHMPWA